MVGWPFWVSTNGKSWKERNLESIPSMWSLQGCIYTKEYTARKKFTNKKNVTETKDLQT